MADCDCRKEGCAICDPPYQSAIQKEIADLRAQLEQAQADRGDLIRDAIALEELRKAIAEVEGCDVETWPGHGNKALAIAAQYMLNLQTIASQRAWIEKAGHRPGCSANLCAHPNCDTYRDEIYHGPNLRGHLFQPGACDCDYSNFVEK